MVVFHQDHPPQTVGSLSGRPPKTYPAGRRCECGALLSIYNSRSRCAACGAKGGPMTTRERVRKMLEDAHGEWVKRPDDVPKGTWSTTLHHLRKAGVPVETRHGRHDGGARIPMPSQPPQDAQTAQTETPPSCPQESRDGAETPQGTTDTPEGQVEAQGAAQEPERWVSPSELVEHAEPKRDTEDDTFLGAARRLDEGMRRWRDARYAVDHAELIADTLPPFAGQLGETMPVEIIDPEVAALDAITHALEPLSHEGRRRVLEFAADRYLVSNAKE